MQSGIGVEGFTGVTEEDGVCAGGEVTEGVVDEVGCGGAEDVADRAEVVGQCPRYAGGRGVGEEFVLLVRRPEVMVRGGAIIDLDCRLVIFGDEDDFIVADYLANPDVVIIVSVFHDLRGGPILLHGVPLLLHDGGQAVAVVPRVEFAVRGVGFGNPVAFGVVRVGPRTVGGQFVVIAGRVSVAVGCDAVAVFVVGIGFIVQVLVGVVRADELAEEVIIVGSGAVNGIEVLDNIVGIIVGVGVLDDLRSVRVFMRDRRDGVVRVERVKRFRDGGHNVIGVFFVTAHGGHQTVGIVVELGEDFVHGGAGLGDFCCVAEKIISHLICAVGVAIQRKRRCRSTTGEVISVGEDRALGVEVESRINGAIQRIVGVRVRMLTVGGVQQVADRVVGVHEVVGRIAPVFRSQTPDRVVGVGGDPAIPVGFGNEPPERVVGIVPRRVFLVRLGRDQAHVVVRVRGRVPDRIGIGKSGGTPPLHPSMGKEQTM